MADSGEIPVVALDSPVNYGEFSCTVLRELLSSENVEGLVIKKIPIDSSALASFLNRSIPEVVNLKCISFDGIPPLEAEAEELLSVLQEKIKHEAISLVLTNDQHEKQWFRRCLCSIHLSESITREFVSLILS